eukprot:9237620-Alexandrium_andersonii.AAC.1
MSASLVGSEMCIRDSPPASFRHHHRIQRAKRRRTPRTRPSGVESEVVLGIAQFKFRTPGATLRCP